ncbi:PQQ-binding-like beta-propeller repeat protein [Saccharomonospora sp. NPDC006951]
MRARIAVAVTLILLLSGCASGDRQGEFASPLGQAGVLTTPAFDPPRGFAASGTTLGYFEYGGKYLVVGDSVVLAEAGARSTELENVRITDLAGSDPVLAPHGLTELETTSIAGAEGRSLAFVGGFRAVPGSGTVPDGEEYVVTAYRLPGGEVAWEKVIPEWSEGTGEAHREVVIADADDETVLLDARTRSSAAGGTRSITAMALNARDGSTRWSQPGFAPYAITPDVVVGFRFHNGVRCGSCEGALAGLETGTGVKRWEREPVRREQKQSEGYERLGEHIVKVRIVHDRTPFTHFVDAATGEDKAKLPGSRDCEYDGRDLIVCGTDSVMTGYDARTFGQRWSFGNDTGGREVPELRAASNGVVYAESSNGLMTLDGATGDDLDPDLGELNPRAKLLSVRGGRALVDDSGFLRSFPAIR